MKITDVSRLTILVGLVTILYIALIFVFIGFRIRAFTGIERQKELEKYNVTSKEKDMMKDISIGFIIVGLCVLLFGIGLLYVKYQSDQNSRMFFPSESET